MNEKGDAELLKRTPGEISITEYKSAFYQFLAKPDSMMKVYPQSAIIEIADIYELNDRVCEKLSHYEEAGFIIQTNVKFSNGKTNSFSDWLSFTSHQWYESESISNITINWTFNAMFPGHQVPEKHTLVVKLSNGLKPEEMLNLVFNGKIEEIEELDSNVFPIVARVDFVNRVLGDELLNIVGEWVKTLKETSVKKSKFVLYLKGNKGKVTSLLSWITNFIVMSCSVIITGNFIFSLKFDHVAEITNEQLIYIFYAVFACSATWIFGRKIIGIFTDTLFESLRRYGENALFDITKGDHNRQKRLRNSERAHMIKIFVNIFITIALNISCGILVNLLFK